MLFSNKLLNLIGFCLLAPGYIWSQSQATQPQRDANALEILARTVNAAGGAEALAAIRDITESGSCTFVWGDGVTAPTTIKILGGRYFRMEADFPDGMSTWTVVDGVGFRKQGDNLTALSAQNSVNFGNLTYPLGHIAVALADPTTTISLVRIESRNGRSVYRIHLSGTLGLLSSLSASGPITKDLIVDALTYDVLAVEDQPFSTYQVGGRKSTSATRTINFENFQAINGIRIPFTITTSLLGQSTLTISLTSVAFNNNLSNADFSQ